ncbi:Uma2 family endonuclease [Anthocerotibacter panamensis]|uniref:Uma2 family endonuclease n=1 Tax=Anthocerotibacter panamensis TaxID=2857077 RepID=UPI001C407A55|nr:Uma2 family endonuclease [Anthocerotibacter panamensis]
MTPTTATETEKLTFAQYLDFQGEPGVLYELYRGQLIPMATPSAEHTQICEYLAYCFQRYITTQGLELVAKTTVGVRTQEDSARIPDVVVCERGLWEALRTRSGSGVLNLGETPCLVVEVVSDNRRRDYIQKRAEYAMIEVCEYWIIDPRDQQVWVLTHPEREDEIYERAEFRPGQTIVSAIFSDLKLPVLEVLAPPLTEDLIRIEQQKLQQEIQARQLAEQQTQQEIQARQLAEQQTQQEIQARQLAEQQIQQEIQARQLAEQQTETALRRVQMLAQRLQELGIDPNEIVG